MYLAAHVLSLGLACYQLFMHSICNPALLQNFWGVVCLESGMSLVMFSHSSPHMSRGLGETCVPVQETTSIILEAEDSQTCLPLKPKPSLHSGWQFVPPVYPCLRDLSIKVKWPLLNESLCWFLAAALALQFEKYGALILTLGYWSTVSLLDMCSHHVWDAAPASPPAVKSYNAPLNWGIPWNSTELFKFGNSPFRGNSFFLFRMRDDSALGHSSKLQCHWLVVTAWGAHSSYWGL